MITPQSLALFLEFARDAGNWDGQPLVGGNVQITKEERGNLTQLKVEGLLTTFTQDRLTWVTFTDAGRALAKQHGVEL
jgi:hypothetical protein